MEVQGQVGMLWWRSIVRGQGSLEIEELWEVRLAETPIYFLLMFIHEEGISPDNGKGSNSTSELDEILPDTVQQRYLKVVTNIRALAVILITITRQTE